MTCSRTIKVSKFPWLSGLIDIFWPRHWKLPSVFRYRYWHQQGQGHRTFKQCLIIIWKSVLAQKSFIYFWKQLQGPKFNVNCLWALHLSLQLSDKPFSTKWKYDNVRNMVKCGMANLPIPPHFIRCRVVFAQDKTREYGEECFFYFFFIFVLNKTCQALMPYIMFSKLFFSLFVTCPHCGRYERGWILWDCWPLIPDLNLSPPQRFH